MSDHDEGKVDPFRRLEYRRAEAEAAGTDPEKARKRALVEAFESITPTVEKKAKFTCWRDEEKHLREDAIQEALAKLLQRCNQIYDGEADPPETSWEGYIATTVKNKGFDILRKECNHGVTGLSRAVYFISLDAPDSTGNPSWDSIPADGAGIESWTPVVGVADAALNRVGQDALLRGLNQLHANVASGKLVCAFHSGRRCPHLQTGRIVGTCRHLDVVFEAIGTTIISTNPEPIRKLLIGRTNYDSNRQGHQLERHVYRCLDWFTYLLFRDFSSPFVGDLSTLSELLMDRVAQHLIRGGTDASETTLCIIMNYYPDLQIPTQLMHKYGPVHLDRTEGESR